MYSNVTGFNRHRRKAQLAGVKAEVEEPEELRGLEESEELEGLEGLEEPGELGGSEGRRKSEATVPRRRKRKNRD